MSQLIPPGSTIGILGGGQLGRMSAMAAMGMGYHTHVYCPIKGTPGKEVASRFTDGSYDDEAALKAFAKSVDVVTCEFENVPAGAASVLEKYTRVHPSAEALRIAQHRGREKEFIGAQGIRTAPYALVNSKEEAKAAWQTLGAGRALMKTATQGYDGKGQFSVRSEADLAQMQPGTDYVLEGFVDFACEISAIVARTAAGKMAAFPVGENVHKNGILHTTTVPANVPETIAKEAQKIAEKLAVALGIVGLLAVEFFVGKDGTLYVNELAPRPHNSGHWTMDGCAASQFEQLIRAICGLPLGATDILAPTVMTNLIGDDVKRWQDFLKQNPRAQIHLYGKSEARPGRKMGHVNVLGE